MSKNDLIRMTCRSQSGSGPYKDCPGVVKDSTRTPCMCGDVRGEQHHQSSASSVVVIRSKSISLVSKMKVFLLFPEMGDFIPRPAAGGIGGETFPDQRPSTRCIGFAVLRCQVYNGLGIEACPRPCSRSSVLLRYRGGLLYRCHTESQSEDKCRVMRSARPGDALGVADRLQFAARTLTLFELPGHGVHTRLVQDPSQTPSPPIGPRSGLETAPCLRKQSCSDAKRVCLRSPILGGYNQGVTP